LEVFAITNPGLVVPEKNQITGKLKDTPIHDPKLLRKKRKRAAIKWIFIILAATIVGYLFFNQNIFEIARQFFPSSDQTISKKSIAVLPFINDSNDSTNFYLINGLMESTLNNLQKIKDLRVISRTSVEKYRNYPKTIPEIARELNVKYIVEGSGQKIGDQILFNIQLIDASSDKHLWADQYNRETKDIFELQMEVAKIIADKIEVIITPEEEERINKPPTDNLVAYDYFLKGLDLMFKGTRESLEEAISYFQKATVYDDGFANAYADIAIAYFYLDIFKTEKQYADSILKYADKALLNDPKLSQSLMAKAYFYMNKAEYELAVPYLEKALEYNPNSAIVINTLSDFYANYLLDTEKYLEYALKGIQLDIAAHDSITASYIYLHLSNAFIQSGFIDEAEEYINKSLEYYPENLYSAYVKAYILYAKNGDLRQTKELLVEVLSKDTTRLDVMQEVGKICYYMRDYDSAYKYYKKFIEIREAQNLVIYRGEDAKIGVVLSKLGLTDESERLFSDFKDYAENNKSVYKHLSLAAYFSYKGDTKNALEQMKLFSQQKNYHYWIILFLEIDPLMDNIKHHPEFRKILNDIKNDFRNYHKRVKDSLEGKGLL